LKLKPLKMPKLLKENGVSNRKESMMHPLKKEHNNKMLYNVSKLTLLKS